MEPEASVNGEQGGESAATPLPDTAETSAEDLLLEDERLRLGRLLVVVVVAGPAEGSLFVRGALFLFGAAITITGVAMSVGLATVVTAVMSVGMGVPVVMLISSGKGAGASDVVRSSARIGSSLCS